MIDREHAGIYTCKVTTKADNLTLVQNLEVITELPKLKPVENRTFLKSTGSNITMPCLIESGIPAPNLQWKFNSQSLEFTDSKLILKYLSLENQGTYSCMAVNEYGSDILTYELEVVDPPRIKVRNFFYIYF